MNQSKHKPFLTIRDNSVSGEVFDLLKDEDLDMLITSPQPQGADLDKYYESDDYISHTDGKRSVFESAYQLIKGIALKNKLALINKLQKSKGHLLDIGAGTGDFLATTGNDGWIGTGIEPNQKANAIAENKGVKFAANTESLTDASFDVITMWHVLEHVSDLDKQVSELKRMLKPDGTIIIAVPNFKSYDANYYGAFWAAYDVPRHLWHFSKTSIEKLFAKYDLELVDVLPMKFDAFYVSLLSEKYKTGNMNPFRAFLTGMKSNLKAKQSFEYSSHIYIIKRAKRQ